MMEKNRGILGKEEKEKFEESQRSGGSGRGGNFSKAEK